MAHPNHLYSPELESALRLVAAALNEAGVAWAVGGSALLRRLGFPELPNDLDLLVALPDADTAHEVLQKHGTWERGEPNPPFASRRFYRYRIDGIDVEMIGGFRIGHEAGTFELPFGADDAVMKPLNGTDSLVVPFALPEDWWLAYRLMPSASKQGKAERLYKLLLECGSSHPNRLRSFLRQSLPPHIREQAEKLLASGAGT